jgi:hypothetical protein
LRRPVETTGQSRRPICRLRLRGIGLSAMQLIPPFQPSVHVTTGKIQADNSQRFAGIIDKRSG